MTERSAAQLAHIRPLSASKLERIYRASRVDAALEDVTSVLSKAETAWNRADLNSYMTCYEQAATTVYVSGTVLIRGYDAIRTMYLSRYGDKSIARMGQLKIEILDFIMAGDENAHVIGHFRISRHQSHGGDVFGSTTLLFKQTPVGWRICVDHS